MCVEECRYWGRLGRRGGRVLGVGGVWSRVSRSHSAAIEGGKVCGRRRSRLDNGDEAEKCRGSGRGGSAGGGGGGGGAELGIAVGPLDHFAPPAAQGVVLVLADARGAQGRHESRGDRGCRCLMRRRGVWREGVSRAAGTGRAGAGGRVVGDAVGAWMGCGWDVVGIDAGWLWLQGLELGSVEIWNL